MHMKVSLLDKSPGTKTEHYTILNLENDTTYSFFLRHNELNNDRLNRKIIDNIAYGSNINKFEIIRLDDYSPNLLVLYRNNNKVTKYVVFKSW